MSRYLHGAYGEIAELTARESADTKFAPVYVGTAPVHTVLGTAPVNTPVLLNSFGACAAALGYSDDWKTYTLCEAMYAHFALYGTGPAVFINVLDPAKASPDSEKTGTLAATPKDGRIVIPAAQNININSVKVAAKTLGTDYLMGYDWQTQTITITEIKTGGLGESELNITWDNVDPKKVQAADVIGATDEEGVNTGLYAIRSVYMATGFIPSLLLAPGWSEQKEVHDAMVTASQNVNGHWQTMIYTDIPVLDSETQMTLSGAAAWKTKNGYNTPYEKVHFPQFKTMDGRIYHLSTLESVALQAQIMATGGIPYRTASNTPLRQSDGLYFGKTQLSVDEDTLSRHLNANGITTAAYVGGQWVLWGAHMADYDHETPNRQAVADTARMMLIYLCNDFQRRHARDVDQPISRARLSAIAFEEQAALDALVSAGALIYGRAELVMDADAQSDMMLGDFKYRIEITTTPLSRSLTAYVSWTESGLASYFIQEGVG